MSGRVYERKFDWDEARALRAQGLTHSEIAQRFGVSRSAIQRVVEPGFRARQARYKRSLAGRGRCDDCGGPMNQVSRYGGSTRCVECAAKARSTTARETELRCVTCHEWKPDDAFQHDRQNKIARRGRHDQCRACNTAARRDYRRRNRDKQRAYDRAYKAKRRAQERQAA